MNWKNKHLKNTLALLIALSLIVQFFPLSVHAGALDAFWKGIAKLFNKLKLPDEIILDTNGNVFMGSWKLLKCIYRILVESA